MEPRLRKGGCGTLRDWSSRGDTVSGIDLDVQTRVAQEMGWKPEADLIKDIHEGDPSLRQGRPLAYWGLEPFWDDRSDWKFRYASVFQIGERPQRMPQDRAR